MTSQTPEKFLIHNQNELKTHLSLGFEIFIPEFQKEIELTREELDELKRKIIENKENKVEIEKIIKKITIDKAKKVLDTEETTVAGLTGVKTEKLKDDVSKQKESKERQTKLVESQNNEIASIDVSKGVDIQKKSIETLEIGLALLIQNLAILGVKKEDLKDYTKLKSIFAQNKDKLDSGMQAVGHKMLEIFSNGSSELKMYFVSKGPKIISTALSQVKDLQDIASHTASNTNIPEGNKLMEFATKHPVISGAVAIAGVYGFFKFIGSLFGGDDKKSDGKEKGFFDAIGGKWKWIIGGVLGMFGLGQFAGMEGVKKFFKEQFNFDIDESRVLKAMECFSKGDFIDGFKVLFLGVDSLNDKPKKGEAFYKKVAKDINETDYVKKNIRGGIDWKIIKKFGGTTTKKFRGFGDSSIRFFQGLIGSNTDENLHITALKKYLDDNIESKNIDIKENDKLEYTLGQIVGETETSSGDTKTGGDTEAEGEKKNETGNNKNGGEKVDNASIETAKTWPWIAGVLAGKNATGEDRTLASRVLEYAGKSMYYDSLYDKYLKYNSIDVGGTRIFKMKKIFNKGDFGNTGSLDKIIQVEEKGGFQRLLAELQESKDPVKIKSLKKEIDSYLKANKRFEMDFNNYVRNAEIKGGILNENIDKIDEFNRFKEEEVRIGNEIHETSKKFEDEIINLRKTENDPKELAKKEAEIRKRYSDAIDGPKGKKIELRDTQNKMMKNLEIISTSDSAKAKEFFEANKYRIKTSKLPGGKVGLALMGITVGSIALQGVKDKERLALMGAEAVGGFVPFVNMGLDAKQIVSGKDLAGGDLVWWEQFGLAPAFLVLDTIGSLAAATGIGAIAGVPILISSSALKGSKLARTAKEAIKVAEGAHTAEGLVKQTKTLEELRTLGINFIGGARDISKVPSDFIAKYREGMQLAYSSGWLKTVGPLATASKLAVYGGLGYSVCTGIGEIGSVVIDKVNGFTSKVSPVLDMAKTLM